jgi:hypothetical protein
VIYSDIGCQVKDTVAPYSLLREVLRPFIQRQVTTGVLHQVLPVLGSQVRHQIYVKLGDEL